MLHNLSDRHLGAIREATTWIQEQFNPRGIIVSGTIVRGNPGPSSDLDIAVVHKPHWRQRVQRFFNGVPADVFVNPEFRYRQTFAEEIANGRPVMAHLISTGEIVHDPDGMLPLLQALAAETLAGGPRISAESLALRKYAIATGFEDAQDIRDVDPDRAHAMITEALVSAVNLFFLQMGRWLPRPKVLLSGLDEVDPSLATAVRSALRESDLEIRLERSQAVVHRIVGETGFFVWESEQQPLRE